MVLLECARLSYMYADVPSQKDICGTEEKNLLLLRRLRIRLLSVAVVSIPHTLLRVPVYADYRFFGRQDRNNKMVNKLVNGLLKI